ncbi:tetratricopeptide repeat protein [Borrelia sp. BU AG58]|uniref:tetratricopeptide repeat protein n=1 Tax=Borrelia sp. BU AG58 TaxID=2887345 RepID=UPI001E6388CB|nr:tetratricopeptide repeat protein [Borrelia sp. BU AG58]UER67510.1 tetratricopeptide repeat protein [Borrelia sp. BU AG58]
MRKLMLISILLFSCYTASLEELTKETPHGVYLREAQKAMNLNDYQSALSVYEKMIKNHKGSSSVVATGKYEIAFINYITGKKETAKNLFEELIKSGTKTPRWILTLSKKMIEKIEKTKA